MDGLLGALQFQILLLLYHFYIIPVYHMIRGDLMFSESRLVVSVCRLLPLVPCVGPPLNNAGCLDSVVFESDTQGSSSLSYVVHRAVHAIYLVDGIHGLDGILLVLQLEQVLANDVGRFEGIGNAMLFKHSHCCF